MTKRHAAGNRMRAGKLSLGDVREDAGWHWDMPGGVRAHCSPRRFAGATDMRDGDRSRALPRW
jgi:hypothetical protein